MEAAGSSREQEEQKPKNRVPFYKLFSFADFWDYVLMALGSFAAIVHGVSVPVWFIFFGKLINSLGLAYLDPPAAAKTVARYSWDFVYLALVMMASSWAEVACWMQSGERQVTRIRLAYLRAILNRDISYFDAESFSGEVVSAITADILIVQDAISEKVGNFLHYFSRFVAGFAIGFATIWQLSLVTLSIVPAIAISGGLHAFLLINLTAKTRKAYVRAGGIAEEVIGNVRTVYAFVGEEKAVSRYKNALKDTYYLGKKSGLAKGFGLGCMYGILFLCWALLVWYTARLVHRGLINGGEAFTTMLNVVIAGLALGQSAPDLGAFTRARGAAYSIFHMIEQSKESVLRSSSNSSGGGLTLKIVEGNVEFKNVCFSYPSRPDIPIFENLNFHIPAGQVVAIVGGSGSGKSTVISLIERFYDPTSGQVLFDNYDLKSFDLKWLRRQIGLVNQEPVLFACSIRENILYGKEDATMTEITQAAKLADADSFISALPNRYETQVGERGIQMSGGQKQRIAIARAMVKNPSILLLDEATSALDAESEKSVQEALDRVLAGRTTVIVAHRLSTIKNADIIAVVQDGKIVEMGDHKSLISKEGGAYAALVKLQESGGIDKASQEFGSARHSHSMQNRLSSQRTMSFGAASFGAASIASDRGSSRRFGSELDDRDLDMGLTPKKKVPFSRLVKIAAPEWMYAIPAVFGAISAGSLTPLFGLGITQAMVYLYTEDEATSSRNIRRISFFFVGGAGASLVCNVVSHFDWGVIGESLTLRVREMMFAALLRTEVGWFDEENNNSGSLASRLASDATMVRGLVVDRTAIFIHNISLVSTAFLIAFLEQWKLALVILAVYPLLVAAQMAERYFMVGFGGNLSKAYLKANMVAAESVSNIRTVAAFCAEDKVVETFYKALEEPRKRSFARGQVAGICYGITQFMMFSSYGLALWYASTLIKHYEASFGSVIKTFMVLIVSALIVAETLAVCPDLIKAANAVASVFEIVDRQTQILPDDPAAEDVKTVQGNIELKHVNFSYPSRPDTAIFEDFNLKVKAGYSMALVGSSGSGKSSVISLILRFYEPTAGTVLVDGKDIRKLKLRSLRRHIGLVQQEPALFSTTIYENILYGKDGATEAEVIEAAKLANAHGFISSLPAGYHTEVGERGVQLSGGQKQRVAIARAVLKDPSILLLDEATSALDAESERVVQDALNRLMKNRTTVMIAHRLSTVQNADVISVLQNGKIVEQGTHSSLVSNPNSAYSKLIRLQNSSAAAASQIDSGT